MRSNGAAAAAAVFHKTYDEAMYHHITVAYNRLVNLSDYLETAGLLGPLGLLSQS
jgi:hypothetical protein